MAEVQYAEPEASGLTKDDVNQLAEDISADLNYRPGGPLEPIVAELGGKIRYQNFWELESSASGSIRIHGQQNFEIFLPEHTGPMRDRFTVAHELGHYFIHYLYRTIEGEDLPPMQARRYGTGKVEWEANWFAAGFLMPKKAFKASFKKAKGNITSVAEKFGVSTLAANVRAKSLGLTA